MATTLALRFLAFILFIFMNGYGICGRDLKVELQDQKEVDNSQGAKPVSTNNDEPNYLIGYRNTPKSTKLDYKASYTSKKQNHPSHHGNLNDEPYITGYITTPDSTHDYKASYTSKKHNHPSHHDEKLDEPYITGYITTPKSTQSDYKTSYTSKNHDEKLNEPYITGYITTSKSTQSDYKTSYTSKNNDKKLNEPYITGYITTPKSTQSDYKASYTSKNNDKKLNEPYITGYITTPKSTQSDYKASYTFKNHEEKLNEPYITGYITSNHDSKQDNHDPKAVSHDSTKPYVTSYGFHPKKDSKESATQDSNDEPYITQYGNHDSTKPYVTSYGLHPKKESKESATQDSNDEPYITQYGNHDSTKPYVTSYGLHPKKESKESATQDSNDEPYITQYGNHDSKQDYAATYKRKQEESKKGPSSHVDHTEAFKTGFFSLDDLYEGNIMTLQFPVQEFSHFLPRKEADSIPFSTSQLPSLLQLFSISEDSPMVKSMRGTLEQCEAETITGETKICANSLESMLEFVSTIIGSDTKYDILTTSHPTPSATPLQKYTILEVSKDIYAPKWVACHPLPYPYAVYYCHFIATGSKVFKVLLSGENGDEMEALGICHLDTSDWSPDHILFKQLGFMPGEAPVCHFFPVKHLMWVPQPLTATM